MKLLKVIRIKRSYFKYAGKIIFIIVGLAFILGQFALYLVYGLN